MREPSDADRALHARAREVFLELHGADVEACAQRLVELSASEPQVAREVRELLAQLAGRDPFLQSPLASDAAAAPEALPAIQRVGDYRILAAIGRGGMGVVYLAEQERPRRRVALKLLRREVADRDAAKRFRREITVLGRLEHPGIARIYEAGVERVDGVELPWFAMEFVEGRPLAEHARREQLGMRERVQLIAEVCDAVEAAHLAGVVHRDLKPDNILVEPGGRARVLDFGVAAVTDRDVELTTLHTLPGQLVGTISYMSPEQASGKRGSVDARSDVYSLGVILFELLTGELPCATRSTMLHEAVRAIREDEPTSLVHLRPELGRELAAVVGKALAKEPPRRYASASDFATDLRRWLADEPVLARAPSASYKLWKFARRHRALSSSALLGVLALAGGLVLALAGLRAERRQRAVTSDTLDYFADNLLDLAPQLGYGEEQREALEGVAARIERQLEVDPRSRPLRVAQARLLYELASLDQARGDHAGLRVRAERVRAIRQALVDEDPGDLGSWTQLSSSYAKLGEAERDLGDPALRDTWFARALELDERLVREHPGELELVEDLGWSLARVAQVAAERGDREQAERLSLRRLADAEMLVQLEPGNWKYAFNLSHVHHALNPTRDAPDPTREHSQATVRFARRAVELQPARRDLLDWLAEACLEAARRAADADLAAACDYAEEALATAERMVVLHPHRASHVGLLIGASRDCENLLRRAHRAADVERIVAALRKAAKLAQRQDASSAKALADLADEMDARAANAEQAHASDAALRRE